MSRRQLFSRAFPSTSWEGYIRLHDEAARSWFTLDLQFDTAIVSGRGQLGDEPFIVRGRFDSYTGSASWALPRPAPTLASRI